MKLTSNGLRYLSKIASGSAISIIGGGVIAPTVSFLVKLDKADLTLLVFSALMFVLFFVVSFFGYIIEIKSEMLEKIETKCDHITQQSNLHMFD